MSKRAIRKEKRRMSGVNALEHFIRAYKGVIFQYAETGKLYEIKGIMTHGMRGHSQLVCEDQATAFTSSVP